MSVWVPSWVSLFKRSKRPYRGIKVRKEHFAAHFYGLGFRQVEGGLGVRETFGFPPSKERITHTLTQSENTDYNTDITTKWPQTVWASVSKCLENFRCMIIYFALISPYWYLRLKGLWLMYPAPPSICFLFFSQCTYFYFSVFWILVCSILFILLIDILLLPYQQILQFNWYANKVMIILDGPVLSKN